MFSVILFDLCNLLGGLAAKTIWYLFLPYCDVYAQHRRDYNHQLAIYALIIDYDFGEREEHCVKKRQERIHFGPTIHQHKCWQQQWHAENRNEQQRSELHREIQREEFVPNSRVSGAEYFESHELTQRTKSAAACRQTQIRWRPQRRINSPRSIRKVLRGII